MQQSIATGTWWLQTGYVPSLAYTYPLLLNPNGGNVGIGTTSPTNKLDVNGGITANSLTLTNNWALSMPTSEFYDSGDGRLYEDANYLYFRNSAGTTTYAGINSTSFFNGNVGIGTTNPTQPLTITTGSGGSGENDGILVNQNGTGPAANIAGTFLTQGAGAYNTGVFARAINGTIQNIGVRINGVVSGTSNYALYSDSAAQSYFQGNVGIGTTAPVYPLDVNGQVNASGYCIIDCCINNAMV